ncbi:MAG: hydrogenase formation protein HypD [Bacteroidetes bacterium RBG_13_43_22]|nr:MAG: hydrogenase formation protein HypD [Bacteroidetes bacterium RBG_13_43_22]
MKYIDEYRNKDLIMKLADRIKRSAKRDYTFMEVCGGHTAAIHRFGIPSLLPNNIKLISGPGCPVCVTGTDFIDKAITYSREKDVIITTFGDLIRVPGSVSSLEKQTAAGADVRIVFSGLDALETAKSNPQKKILFLGIGFETTAPGTAVTIKQADREHVGNFFVLSAHKVMPPAMEAIVREGTKLNGFICPGHVAAITGSSIFNFLPEKYQLGCVIAGFEPTDLLQAILMLIEQVNRDHPKVEIQYRRAVTEDGNLLAQKSLEEVFITSDAYWRGFGMIPKSGLIPGKRYEKFSAEHLMPVTVEYHEDNKMCICPEILRGLKDPDQCPLFAGVCSPENPVGACMVSGEGSCNTWYKYNRDK